MSRYTAFGPWMKATFGARVHKVSVDGGFTCPNRDGTVARGGCTYCNNESFRARGTAPGLPLSEQVREGIRFAARRFGAEKFLVYWQHFSNTYAPVERLRQLYAECLEVDPRILGMTIGTRPDCVEEEKLQLLQEFAERCYVCLELGLESIHERTLRSVNRGHDVECLVDAVQRSRIKGLPICCHIILGLPGENRSEQLAYTDFLNRLGIQFLKIHHLHVVAGTRLAEEYSRNPFPTYSCEEWVTFVCDFLERLDPRIVIQRLFGWTRDSQLVEPRWNKSTAEILQLIHRELIRRDTWQGKLFTCPSPAAAGPGL